MNKESGLLSYNSPQIDKNEVFLEHIIADSDASGENYVTPNGHEAMTDGDWYGTGDESEDWL